MGLKWFVIRLDGVGGRGEPFKFFRGFLIILETEDFSFDERGVAPFCIRVKIGKVKFKFDDDGLVWLSTMSSSLYCCSLFFTKLACPGAPGTFDWSLSESGLDVEVFLLAY